MTMFTPRENVPVWYGEGPGRRQVGTASIDADGVITADVTDQQARNAFSVTESFSIGGDGIHVVRPSVKMPKIPKIPPVDMTRVQASLRQVADAFAKVDPGSEAAKVRDAFRKANEPRLRAQALAAKQARNHGPQRRR